MSTGRSSQCTHLGERIELPQLGQRIKRLQQLAVTHGCWWTNRAYTAAIRARLRPAEWRSMHVEAQHHLPPVAAFTWAGGWAAALGVRDLFVVETSFALDPLDLQ